MKKDIYNILVIRLSSLGDILLTTPVLRALKRSYPNAEITFLCREEYSEAVEANPNVAQTLKLQININEVELNRIIKDKEFDFIADLQNNRRSKNLLKHVKSKIYKFNKPTLKKFLLVNFKINLYRQIQNIPDLYAASIPGLLLDEEGLDLFIPPEVECPVKEGVRYIGFIPGSKHYTKRWPVEYFIQLGSLLSKYGYTILLFGGKSDTEICKNAHSMIKKSIDLSNDNNLLVTASAMRQCSLIVGNDSGLMHAASAVNGNLITIFGSSVEEFGFAPYNNGASIIQDLSLRCRPCSHIGKKACPKKHFKCMIDVTPNILFEKIKQTLSL